MPSCLRCGADAKEKHIYCAQCGAELDAPLPRERLIEFTEENPEAVVDLLIELQKEVHNNVPDSENETDEGE
jgi:uncharacterized membrane protein YvbJ